MLIIIVFLGAFYIGLFYGVYQDIKKSIAKKQAKIDRRLEARRLHEQEDLKRLDMEERLQSMEAETVYILNQIANETDSNKVIKLHKEFQRVQKQRYIAKYKES